MITLVTGIPGSGKSYYAVHHISKLNVNKRSKVLQNIDGLKLGVKLDTICKDRGISPLDLFRDSFHQNCEDFRGFLFVIDECQTIFPTSFKDQDVLRFFQLHRHYGIDIILLSQDYKLVSSSITLLAELQLRAVSDVANPIPGTFLYKKMVGTEQIGTTRVKKDKKVFALYKTADFDQGATRKKSRPMLMIFVLCGVALVAAFFYARHFVTKLKDHPEQAKKETLGPVDRIKRKLAGSESPNNSNQEMNDNPEQYPDMSKTIGGYLLPVSYVKTSNRKFTVIMMGIPFDIRFFPYPLIRTQFGLYAHVPRDLFLYAQNDRQKRIDKYIDYDPNAKYINASYSQSGGVQDEKPATVKTK